MKILIFGNGYVGERCKSEWGKEAELSPVRILSFEDVVNEIDRVKPDAVLNAAGKIGKPNVDWCETHEWETVEGNALLPMIIAKGCAERGVYLLHIGTGCIFYGDSPDPRGWREDDFGNPQAVYTKAKYAADLALQVLPNIGIGRIRMPLDDRPNDRNIIDKLVSYKKVIDVRNSLTVVDEMVRIFYELMQKKATGVFHVTQTGAIAHREILELYKKYVGDPGDKEWINEEDLVKQSLAARKRSTNILQNDRLADYGIAVKGAYEAVEEAMKKYGRIVQGRG